MILSNVTCTISELYGNPPPSESRREEGFSLGQQKHELDRDLTDLCRIHDISHSELRTCKVTVCIEAREKMCVLAHDRLSSHLSSAEIATFLAIPRTTYMYGLKRWRERNYGEAVVRIPKPNTYRSWSYSCPALKETKENATNDSQPKKSLES